MAGIAIVQTTLAGTVHQGVFCTKTVIARGSRFGPFKGRVVHTSEIKTHDDNSCMWEVGATPCWVIFHRRRLHQYHLTIITSPLLPHHYHLIIITSSLSPHYYLIIITSSLSPHHYHLTIITSPLLPHRYHLINITSSLSPHQYHLIVITSPLSPHHYHLTIITSPLLPHH